MQIEVLVFVHHDSFVLVGFVTFSLKLLYSTQLCKYNAFAGVKFLAVDLFSGLSSGLIMLFQPKA